MKVTRISPPGKNFCFGFHDLTITDSAGRILAHQTENLRRPPCQEQLTQIGFFTPGSTEFHRVSQTTAFNYPQGSRLQWWDSEKGELIFNVKIGDNWGSRICNIDGQVVAELKSTAHVAAPEKHLIFGINYARLNRLGAYGYAGLPDLTAQSNAPANDGIWRNDIRKNEPQLIYSIQQGVQTILHNKPEYIHYFTHLVINPSHTRIAFLHRYRISEGELTRLMTIGINGEDPRCLGEGSLSHFDWINDEQIVIWGRCGSSTEKLRTSRLYAIMPHFLLRAANRGYHALKKILHPGMPDKQKGSILIFTDREQCLPQKIAQGVITEDGHMMVNPLNRNWFVCDTYPDKNGVRQLFLYNISKGERVELGEFRRIFDDPDTTHCDDAFRYLERQSLSPIFLKRIAFTRSGLHCDLHPRWGADGETVFFDSIHEGERAIYCVDTEDICK